MRGRLSPHELKRSMDFIMYPGLQKEIFVGDEIVARLTKERGWIQDGRTWAPPSNFADTPFLEQSGYH